MFFKDNNIFIILLSIINLLTCYFYKLKYVLIYNMVGYY
jgi:hypothetical protein